MAGMILNYQRVLGASIQFFSFWMYCWLAHNEFTWAVSQNLVVFAIHPGDQFTVPGASAGELRPNRRAGQ